eukprot:4963077-Lingulodinium_polyedra.AAC.1
MSFATAPCRSHFPCLNLFDGSTTRTSMSNMMHSSRKRPRNSGPASTWAARGAPNGTSQRSWKQSAATCEL